MSSIPILAKLMITTSPVAPGSEVSGAKSPTTAGGKEINGEAAAAMAFAVLAAKGLKTVPTPAGAANLGGNGGTKGTKPSGKGGVVSSPSLNRMGGETFAVLMQQMCQQDQAQPLTGSVVPQAQTAQLITGMQREAVAFSDAALENVADAPIRRRGVVKIPVAKAVTGQAKSLLQGPGGAAKQPEITPGQPVEGDQPKQSVGISIVPGADKASVTAEAETQGVPAGAGGLAVKADGAVSTANPDAQPPADVKEHAPDAQPTPTIATPIKNASGARDLQAAQTKPSNAPHATTSQNTHSTDSGAEQLREPVQVVVVRDALQRASTGKGAGAKSGPVSPAQASSGAPTKGPVQAASGLQAPTASIKAGSASPVEEGVSSGSAVGKNSAPVALAGRGVGAPAAANQTLGETALGEMTEAAAGNSAPQVAVSDSTQVTGAQDGQQVAQTSLPDQIAGQLRASGARLGQQIVIRLNPPELGEVRITLQAEGSSVKGVLEVQNAETLQHIQRAAPALITRLSEGGVQLSRLELTLSADSDRSTADPFGSVFRDGQSGQSHQHSDNWGQHSSGDSVGGDVDDAWELETEQALMGAAQVGDESINVWR